MNWTLHKAQLSSAILASAGLLPETPRRTLPGEAIPTLLCLSLSGLCPLREAAGSSFPPSQAPGVHARIQAKA